MDRLFSNAQLSHVPLLHPLSIQDIHIGHIDLIMYCFDMIIQISFLSEIMFTNTAWIPQTIVNGFNMEQQILFTGEVFHTEFANDIWFIHGMNNSFVFLKMFYFDATFTSFTCISMHGPLMLT